MMIRNRTKFNQPFAPFQVQTILVEDHGIPEAEAVAITNKFLKNFRAFQEKRDVSLDEWRETLWSQALGETYQHIAGRYG